MLQSREGQNILRRHFLVLNYNKSGHADFLEIFSSQISFYWNILSEKVMPKISPHPQCQNQIKQTTGKESHTILLTGLIIIFI